MDLSVQPREVLGKKVKLLRSQGLIPAELYGHGMENIHITVPAKEFAKAFKDAGETTIITLHIDKEKYAVMVHDVARDSITHEIAHIDFHAVRMDEKVRAHVPVEFTGESPAVKAYGAIINKALAEIEVEAFPQDLPHAFTVDLAVLDEVDKSFYVKDLVVPKGVILHVDPGMVIVTATPAKVEEAPVAEAAVDVSAIKTEGEEKKAARDIEKASSDTE